MRPALCFFLTLWPSHSTLAFEPKTALEVDYGNALQPLVNVSVGGQWLQLVLDVSSAYTVVSVQEDKACVPATLEPCYSYKVAAQRGGLHICAENNVQRSCQPCSQKNYGCTTFLQGPANATPLEDHLNIDGLLYDQTGIEAIDDAMLQLAGQERSILAWSGVPVRLLVAPLELSKPPPPNISLDLFRGTNGILGASGASLSCRNTTLWLMLLQQLNVQRFALDFRPPPAAVLKDPGPSRVVFNEIDAEFAPTLLWSQPKQTGDCVNDARHELIVYHPEVCGVDLLYNASSNWLAVIDTSGPCLVFPPFLFDRVRTYVPLDCPFAIGEKSEGRLCSPRGGPGQRAKLPTFSFRLQDTAEPEPPKLSLALERLVFRNATGDELVCIARQDKITEAVPADMMYTHISLGSMAVAAMYTVVDLQNNSIGLATRGDPTSESSEEGCAKPVTCLAMQSFFPPLNLCEDPRCSEYMLMTLDETTKTCVWKTSVPVVFALLVVGLAGLDFLSHRLYKQAIHRASEFSQ